MKRKLITGVSLLLISMFSFGQTDIEIRKTDETHVIFADGQPLGAIVPYQADRIEAADDFREIESGLFEWTRTFTCGGEEFVWPARLTMALEALYPSRYSMIPAVNYNGNPWGTGQEPKGFRAANQLWTFAYHRVSVPGATYSESDAWSIALFSRPGQMTCGFSCSIDPQKEKTVHTLIWPEEESPQVYAARDRYSELYREDLRLSRGEVIHLKAWIVVSPVKAPKLGWKSMLDAAWRLNARPVSPRWEPEDLWELGIRFAKESLWAEEKTFKGFSIGLRWMGQMWIQRPSWKYEIGWAGQNISLANSFLMDFLKTEDRTSLDLGIQCLDTWLKHARLSNGLFRCHFDYLIGLEDPKNEVQDACNLGHAAQGYFEAFDLAEQCGLEKPEYRRAAFGICDFVLKRMAPDGRIGKTWANNGRPVDPEGTIGAFLIPPLVIAYTVSHNKAYLEAAERAFAYYSDDFRKNGFTTAGALDTCCIDKESATPLLKAALALYEITGSEKYLRYAEDVSYYLASWQWHYSVPYPEGTALRDIGYDTFGGTAVSTQHHHQDPYGLIIVNEWLRLAILTKNAIWRERALALWANGTIGISNGELAVMGKIRPAGSQDEGFFHTRWMHPSSVSQWLVAWPTAFRLETLRRAPYWAIFDKER